MNKIYYNSPIFLQHILTSIYGIKLKKKRYNKLYWSYLNEFEQKSDHHTKSSDLINHLKKNIAKYSNVSLKNNNVETLKSLPFTTKDDLRNELDSRSSLKGDILVEKTGGTTGKSLKVYSNESDRASRMAYLDYIKMVHGVRPFSKRASFTGKEIIPQKHKNILWRYNIFMNQVLYASFKLNKENVKYIFRNMKKNKPVTIDGFPSSIHMVAKYILMNNIQINWDVKAIFPTAERLTENMKEDIEKAFNTKVIDQYASSEGAPFIYTGTNGNYIVAKETGFFEFFKVDNFIYEMVVTSYINFATPIVRYKIGDNVIIESTEQYLNSIEDEVNIDKILGRNTDFLIGNEKNTVTSANMSNVVKDLGNRIIQSQFIQHDLNDFSINIVVSEHYNFDKDEQVLIDKLNHRLGTNNKYNFNYLKEIPKEKSGKTRFLINEMGE